MRLAKLSIKNYRSIVQIDDVRIESLQAIVGENNAGKSNTLGAVEVLLTAGLAGVQGQDFFDKTRDIVITGTFCDLTPFETQLLGPHLLGEQLVIRKRLSLGPPTNSGRAKVGWRYYGYQAQPTAWWLSIEGVIAEKGPRPNWRVVAEAHGILAAVQQPNGKVNKRSYAKGVARLLQSGADVEYVVPPARSMQPLGQSPAFLPHLPRFYLLSAITDYATEIDRRSSSTTFRQLMGDLADRILRTDPRYGEIEASLQKIRRLLNPAPNDDPVSTASGRLQILGAIEDKLTASISRLMPTVAGVHLEVLLEETKDFFARGVALKVDDGILTDVLAKGHGLQRSVIFGLLQTLISTQRGELIAGGVAQPSPPIILGLEEPELYIHPQSQRMIFGVLREFAESDQVIYTTHSPAFVDIAAYDCIAVARKENTGRGTRLHQCQSGALGVLDEKKRFQFLNSFGLEQNQLFFARKTILVEGEQDLIAILAAGRQAGCFREFPEEIGYTIVVADNKEEIPKFQRLLNTFGLPYIVWLELDGQGETAGKNKEILDLLAENRCVKLRGRLEDVAGYSGHFGKTYYAKKFFEDPANLTPELEALVKQIFVEEHHS